MSSVMLQFEGFCATTVAMLVTDTGIEPVLPP